MLRVLKSITQDLLRPTGFMQPKQKPKSKFSPRKSRCRVCGNPATGGLSTNPLHCEEWYCDDHHPTLNDRREKLQ